MLLKAIRASSKELFIATVTFMGIALCLYVDSFHDLELQNAVGRCGWVVLIGLLIWETNVVRLQVLIAMMFATAGEHFASGMMQGYIYYFQNIPAYIPPGHGMVYLTAVALARSPVFQLLQRQITWFVLITMALWSLWGVTLAERSDWLGMILFLIYIPCVIWGRSPLVYLAAFFVTTHLELIGTSLQTWTWVPIDPTFSISQGNPPSGVATWYCLVDAVALGGASWLISQWQRLRTCTAKIKGGFEPPEWIRVAAED